MTIPASGFIGRAYLQKAVSAAELSPWLRANSALHRYPHPSMRQATALRRSLRSRALRKRCTQIRWRPRLSPARISTRPRANGSEQTLDQGRDSARGPEWLNATYIEAAPRGGRHILLQRLALSSDELHSEGADCP